MTMQERLASAYGYVREQTDLRPELGLVLGSGLGDFCDRLEETVEIPFGDIPGFPVSTVEGHAGALLLGTCRGRRVAALRGRVHCYEGYTYTGPYSVIVGQYMILGVTPPATVMLGSLKQKSNFPLQPFIWSTCCWVTP